MSSSSIAQLEEASAIHLEQVQNLIHAMVEGMEAIATNSIDELRLSIAKQEELCSRLTDSSAVIDCGQTSISSDVLPSSLRDIQEAVGTARATVQRLCVEYSTLLASSMKTATMLSALYRYHMQADGGVHKHLRWEI